MSIAFIKASNKIFSNIKSRKNTSIGDGLVPGQVLGQVITKRVCKDLISLVRFKTKGKATFNDAEYDKLEQELFAEEKHPLEQPIKRKATTTRVAPKEVKPVKKRVKVVEPVQEEEEEEECIPDALTSWVHHMYEETQDRPTCFVYPQNMDDFPGQNSEQINPVLGFISFLIKLLE